MNHMLFKFFLYTLATLACAGSAFADDLQIAVAANFVLPMQKIAAQFEKDTGYKVITISGATGKFYAQIKNGAPYDIFLAADTQTPTRLEKEGDTVAGSRFTYAVGKLALWSAKPGFVDNSGEVLKNPDLQYIAIANPKLAPYGVAAIETLSALGLNDSLQKKFVQAENIAQAHQFISTGNAEIGFVAVSQIYENARLTSGSVWIVPNNLYSPIRQDGVILKNGQGKFSAFAFVRYLQSDKAKVIIKSYGYDF